MLLGCGPGSALDFAILSFQVPIHGSVCCATATDVTNNVATAAALQTMVLIMRPPLKFWLAVQVPRPADRMWRRSLRGGVVPGQAEVPIGFSARRLMACCWLVETRAGGVLDRRGFASVVRAARRPRQHARFAAT